MHDHSLRGSVRLKPETMLAQLTAALEPLLTYFNRHAIVLKGDTPDNSTPFFCVDPESGYIDINTYGDVPDNFPGKITEMAARLGNFAAEAGYFLYTDYDTPETSERERRIYFGPSAEAINKAEFQDVLNAATDLLKNFVSPSGIMEMRMVAEDNEVHKIAGYNHQADAAKGRSMHPPLSS